MYTEVAEVSMKLVPFNTLILLWRSPYAQARLGFQERWGDKRGAESFADELAAAVNRINYNQGMAINGFAGEIVWH